jgi:phytoene dehydrogenase-like protein
MTVAADAVVIGAGPNGLVAANVLADHGWAVTVLEANAEPGGAVRTAEVTAPGFRNDLFSAFYPMTAASPVMTELDLGAQGLSWTHAPAVLAHPQRNAPAAMLYRDVERTADRLALDHRADAEAYAALTDEWRRVGADVMASLLRPFPPVRPALRLVRRAGVRELGVLARRAVMPVRRFVDEEFGGVAAPLLYAGNALHADLTPESAGSALFGWLLVSVGQQCGFPVPVGGAGAITDALVARLEQRNGTVQCDARVVEVVVRAGRAVGVRTADGDHVAARHAVIADVDATVLYRDLVGEHHLPDRLVAGLGRIERSSATFKVDWALNRPIPWSDPDVADAGTVHIADDMAELARTSAQLATRTVPDRPFVLLGQMTTADPTRSPPGTASVWAYTHVPQHIITDAGGDGITGRWHAPEVDRFVERIERRIEALAPGFGSSILARNVMAPPDMERANANLVGGDTSGGTTQLYQQLVFRPTLGFARAETPVRGLYLGSASAHPGGAVHGACGANAARAALAHRRVSAILRR